MTPTSQHNFSLANVSYIGPAYTEPEGRPYPAAPPPTQVVTAGAAGTAGAVGTAGTAGAAATAGTPGGEQTGD